MEGIYCGQTFNIIFACGVFDNLGLIPRALIRIIVRPKFSKISKVKFNK